MALTRRDALKVSGVAAAALAVTGCSSSSDAASPSGAGLANASTSVGVGSAAALPAPKGPRVVVVGGGWSGLAVAKYTKKYAPNSDVVLIDYRREFVSGPISNLYLVDAVDLQFLTHDFLAAARNNNYTYMCATAVGVDKQNNVLQTSAGDIKYDYLVLAPGIEYDYSRWGITDPATVNRLMTDYPAGMIPGSETLAVRTKVLDFEGGNFVLTVPQMNYRCLPAPYEKACMIADYFKKEGIEGKVILLDNNPDITIKKEGFMSAFKELYANYIEYMPSTNIANIDLENKVVETELGESIEFADAAFYPPVKGGRILEVAGVAKDALNKAEGDIDEFTYLVNPAKNPNKNIYVTGDSRPMPFSKSGNTANTEGHYVGKVIAGRINGKEVAWESPLTVCYSAVEYGPLRAISVNAGYAFDKDKKAWGFANAALDEEWRGAKGLQNGKGLIEWGKGMYRDMFM